MKKKVVVIGGGFAGSYAASHLEHKFSVTLVDTKNYFEFTPGILRTIVEPLHINKIQVLHSYYLKKSRIITGEIIEISKDFVKVSNKRLKFDYLVISSGSRYEWPIKEQNIVISSRAYNLKRCSNQVNKARKILIIGGGLVGVELAAEISTHYKDLDITVIHSGSNLIERNNSKAIEYAEHFLRKRGVKIVFNRKIRKLDKLDCDMAFLCTGITPNFEFMKKYFKNKLDNKNYIKANDYLQLEGRKNIFVAGDIAGKREEKTAQNAEIQAKTVVYNINALENNLSLKKYKSKKRIMVISLGKYNGILEYKNFVLTGIIPAIIKYLIERKIMFMYNYKSLSNFFRL